MKSNAVLLCSGVGRRMAPIQNCVKGVLPIRGEKSNLHRIIRILQESGIEEIVIAIHPDHYQSICELLKDVDNQDGIVYHPITTYSVGCNNSVTVKEISKHISNTFIIECDQYYDEHLCKGIFSNPPTHTTLYTTRRHEYEDWSVEFHPGMDRVKKILTINPTKIEYCLSGITFISENEADMFLHNLDALTSDDYWECAIEPAVMAVYAKRMDPYAIEYDTVVDLIENKLMDSIDIAKWISSDGSAKRLGGMTNTNFLIKRGEAPTVLRLPGYGTSQFIDHEREYLVCSIISKYMPSLIPGTTFYGKDHSVKLCEYLKDYKTLDSLEDIPSVMKKLHDIHSPVYPLFDRVVLNKLRINLYEEISAYERIMHRKPTDCYYFMKSYIVAFLYDSNETACLVHRDLVPLNIMINDSKDIKFIDWEYAGVLNRYWDLASFCCEYADEYNVPIEEVVDIVHSSYPGMNDAKKIYQWIAVVDFVWSAWSLAKMSLGDDIQDYFLNRYNRCKEYIQKYF